MDLCRFSIIAAIVLTQSLAFAKAIKKQSRNPSSSICNVMDFGAAGDAKTKDTAAIQSAINHCSVGGTVLLPSGRTFLSGTIYLKSNLTFKIEPGAALKGSPETADYPDLYPQTQNSQLNNCRKALVYAEGVDNVTIDGGQTLDPTQDNVNNGNSGTIDGNGARNPTWNGPEKTRPMAIFIALSTKVKIQHLQVINAGMWSVVQFENNNVLIDSLKVDSHDGPTRDGIDIVDSSDVTVQNSWVNSEDDSICLKSGNAKGVHQVTVKNCIIANSGVANALKLGTASSGSFDGIRFVAIKIQAAKQAAMAVESVDGATIHGVTFKDIQFDNVGAAAFVLLGKRDGAPKVGSINNIFFENIKGTTNMNWGSVISGSVIESKTYPLSNIHLKNVYIKCLSDGGLTSTPRQPQEYAGGYPDPRLFGPPPLPSFGFFIRHASGVTVESTVIDKVPNDPRKEIVTEDVVSYIHVP